MKKATVGEIQKNFSKILRRIKAGEEIEVTRRGEPIAKIVALGPKSDIVWPDFYEEALELEGKAVEELLAESRDDRL